MNLNKCWLYKRVILLLQLFKRKILIISSRVTTIEFVKRTYDLQGKKKKKDRITIFKVLNLKQINEGEKKTQNRQDKQKNLYNIVESKLHILVITLNGNGLNSPIKRLKVVIWNLKIKLLFIRDISKT